MVVIVLDGCCSGKDEMVVDGAKHIPFLNGHILISRIL
jgi:hypothetical protein